MNLKVILVVKKDYTLYDFIYRKFYERQNQSYERHISGCLGPVTRGRDGPRRGMNRLFRMRELLNILIVVVT